MNRGLLAAALLMSGRIAGAACSQDCRNLITSGYASCDAPCQQEYGTSDYAACHDDCVSRFGTWVNECNSSTNPTPPDCGASGTTTTTTIGGSTTSSTVAASTTTTTLASASRCTEVLGYSQTGMWYLAPPFGGGGFEPIVGDAGWQLRAEGGAGVSWQDPNYIGWTDPDALFSPCASGPIDRVVLTISVASGLPTVDRWVDNIRAEIATIREMRPQAQQIILQPVVGGPNHAVCYLNGTPVHASQEHPTIDQAIAIVAQDAPDLAVGFSPEVRTCADYADTAGHLCYPNFKNCGMLNARTPIGQTIGNFYANW